MQTDEKDVMTSQFFSVISKIERSTRIGADYSYKVTLHGITAGNIDGFKGLLMAEMVEQYEDGVWREVDLTRGDHTVKEPGENGYILDFEIRRKELIDQSSVYQKSLRLFIGDTLCDMDESEIVPVNKQVNNIAELQDRQTDFTTGFKIRKTRQMRELFELSGEVGANTLFPYQAQPARLIQDNIEMITNGKLILNRVDDQYYHVAIYSGNISFFKQIENLKLSDLLLASTNHTWDIDTMAATHACTSPACDFVYPLCEPSDDGSITPYTDDGDRIEMYGGWIWPFIKVKAIWDEIIETAGYSVVGGDVVDSDLFSKIYMPISRLALKSTTNKYLYSKYWSGYYQYLAEARLALPGQVLITGDNDFLDGVYWTKVAGKYTIRITTLTTSPIPTIKLYSGLVYKGDFTVITSAPFITWTMTEYEYVYEAESNEMLVFTTTPAVVFAYYSVSIIKIETASVGYGSDLEPRYLLPDMSQVDLIKMMCNLFGLVPEVNERTKKIRFWNYQELYDNIAIARDWSAYLSERDGTTEFKYGDYAQNNYLKYKVSNDVITDQGRGNMQIDDSTLKEEKTIVEVPVATCDEVDILDNNFIVNVSRIAFNKWNEKDEVYISNKTIDPRIVYVDFVKEIASPPYTKSLWLRGTVNPMDGGWFGPEIVTPKKASSIEVAFSSLVIHYANLSRMLTKTNLRKAKFNLPVYEVAGLQHNIPVYLSQYKAYFYVNKITNYVAGKLCTVELLKL